MKQVNIDLGHRMDELASPTVVSGENKTVYYPSLRIETDKPIEFPHTGKCVVEYTKTRSEESTDKEGKSHYSCTLDVTKILGLEEDEADESPSKSYGKDTEEALDKLVKAKMKKMNHSDREDY